MSVVLHKEVPAQIAQMLQGSDWVCEVFFENEDGTMLGCSRVVDPSLPWVYLSAGIHGDEPAGVLAVAAFLQNGVSDACNWLICPMLNPSGFARQQRGNAKGDDLNRDYLILTSAEIRAHTSWVEKFPVPDLMLSLHEDWEAQGFYFYEINLQEDRPDLSKQVLQAVAQVMPIEEARIIDDHEVRERGWIYHVPRADFPDSWPEAIYFAERGCPLSLTFETPSVALPLKQRIAAHQSAINAAFAWWHRQ